MDPPDLIVAAEAMLAALWERAMQNDILETELKALRRGCMAIAVVRQGIERIKPYAGWDDT